MASVGSKVKSVSPVPWTVWGSQRRGSAWVQVGVVPGREYEVVSLSETVVVAGEVINGWLGVKCVTTGEVFAVRPGDVA